MGAFSMLLGSLCAGVLGDRHGRKPALIGCVVIFGVFSLLTARCTDLGSLMVLRFLTCLGLGGGVPLTIALATDYATVGNPRRLVILMSSGLAIGSTAGGFISRQFVTSFGWQAIFIFGEICRFCWLRCRASGCRIGGVRDRLAASRREYKRGSQY